MTIKSVCVLGGAGFVGQSVVRKLDAAGYQVKVLTRYRYRAKQLILLPNVSVQTCDITDNKALTEALKDSDAVINLIGILHESSRNTFESIHCQLPKRIAKICDAYGVSRFLQMSALGAEQNAPSQYLRSKARGGSVINEVNQTTDITIFKPSVIFGRGDSFLNLFATLVKFSPIIFLAKPEAKFQPIWVEDVASIFVNSLQNAATYGKSYELGGPSIYTLRTLVQKVMHVLSKKRLIIGLNDKLSYIQAFFMEWLPVKLITRDNIRSMEVDSVVTKPNPKEIELTLTPLEAVMPEYISNKTPRAAYNRFRTAAGRAIEVRR